MQTAKPGTTTMLSMIVRSRPRIVVNPLSHRAVVIQRSLTKSASPGEDPLAVLRKESVKRGLCDEHGFRRPGEHWVFSVAICSEDTSTPPNLRTVGLQRISPEGIVFVMKRGGASEAFQSSRPVSLLYLHGKYVMGEKAQQWRSDGVCEPRPLAEIVHRVPHYTISGMVASSRLEKEDPVQIKESSDVVSTDRLIMDRKSHFTEVTQRVRIELENGDISDKELDECITAMRFVPNRMERMTGGPDSILWERWEWLRCDGPDGPQWDSPNQLLPY